MQYYWKKQLLHNFRKWSFSTASKATEAQITELSAAPQAPPAMASLLDVDNALAKIESRQTRCTEQRLQLESLRAKEPLVRDLLAKSAPIEQGRR